MHEYKSLLAGTAPAFIDFMIASQRWNEDYEKRFIIFDNYLFNMHRNESALTQDMVDVWCSVRPEESANANIARTSVVIAFIRYLQKRGLTDVKEPDRPKPQKCTHIPHAFTTEELTRFFYACDHISVQNNRKASLVKKLILCVIFRLMYCTGLRPKEARMLKKNEVDLEHGVLNIVETKGHDQHYVAVHESMIIIMREYDRRMEELVPERVYFFPDKKDGYRSKEWLRENFAGLWKTANPAVHAISYDFRHNYATVNVNKWVDLGFDFYDKLYYLSKSMGHCSVEHTKYYYSIVPRMSEILEDKSGASFEELVPEVMDDEIW